MKIINCGIVTYVITEHHIATICYDFNDGHPRTTTYYDGQLGEIIECENGQTLHRAIQCATYKLKSDEHWEALGWSERERWLARLRGMRGI